MPAHIIHYVQVIDTLTVGMIHLYSELKLAINISKNKDLHLGMGRRYLFYIPLRPEFQK